MVPHTQILKQRRTRFRTKAGPHVLVTGDSLRGPIGSSNLVSYVAPYFKVIAFSWH